MGSACWQGVWQSARLERGTVASTAPFASGNETQPLRLLQWLCPAWCTRGVTVLLPVSWQVCSMLGGVGARWPISWVQGISLWAMASNDISDIVQLLAEWLFDVGTASTENTPTPCSYAALVIRRLNGRQNINISFIQKTKCWRNFHQSAECVSQVDLNTDHCVTAVHLQGEVVPRTLSQAFPSFSNVLTGRQLCIWLSN